MKEVKTTMTIRLVPSAKKRLTDRARALGITRSRLASELLLKSMEALKNEPTPTTK